ncbi:MAG: DUF1559 domain-containing protein [Planctomycetaceae bacterium]|nr:DUF1559 domain-containing protein [Planctomycetaceae bacterium]
MTTGYGDAYQAARSYHSGGVNSSRMDGSVQFVSNTINWTVWQALSAANGRDNAGQ